ncbi:MAG: glycosyltransferase, partial [Candidatus Limnocylindrales bacterium]
APARRIAMYVFNDATLDSRVRREAATLAAAGYTVTVLATAVDPAATAIDRESVDGFEIIRVPIPRGWRSSWQLVVSPWSLRRRSVGRITGALRHGPREWARIPAAAGFVMVALALSATRRGYLALAPAARRAGRQAEWPPHAVTWLVTWRAAILGWCRAASAVAPVADVHHGHDLTALSAARQSARRDEGPAIYDSHEIFVDSGANATRPRWARWLLRRMERRWSRSTVALVTVNQAYAAVLKKRLRPKKTVVVHNCPPRGEPPVRSERLRMAAGVPAGAPIVLYHGAFSRHRGLEELAEAMLSAGLEETHLVYLGYGGQLGTVDRLAADLRFGGRIHVLDAVPPEALLEMVAGADLDAIPLQHSTLNHWLCTPNKLFESLTAGVPVVVSDFPVMRAIVRDDPAGPLGEVCDPADPASIGAAIRRILELDPAARAALRAACRTAANERWNWETESRGLLNLYAGIAT